MSINNIKNTSSVQSNRNNLIARDVTGKYEGGGGSSLGYGAPGGFKFPSFGGNSPVAKPSVIAPKVLPAFRSPVPVPRSVNMPLNGTQIRQSSGVNVGGIGGRVLAPKKQQSKKPVYGPPLPTKAQLQGLKAKAQQKTRAESVPFGSNHWLYEPKMLGNGASNIVSIQRKSKPPNEPASCLLTIHSKYEIVQHAEQFNNRGSKIRDPKAENNLRLSARLDTNRIGSKLSAKVQIGNTDVGVVSSPTVTNSLGNNYLEVKLDGVKSIPGEQLTRDYLNKHKILFDTIVNQGLNLIPGVSAHCVINGVRTPPSVKYKTEIYQNGKRVQ